MIDWLTIIRTVAPKGKPSIVQAVAQAMPQIEAEFALNTTLRRAHFIAQIAHESDGFKTTIEYASGAAYEGRKDLGNTEAGDGKRYKGRGLIQLTGRSNYALASKALGVDFLGRPELAAQFPHAIRLAGWYWKTRKLNNLADADNVKAITIKVNGGLNGFDDRKRYLARAKEALGNVADLPPAKPKDMATSKTGHAALIAGVGGAVATGKEVVAVVKSAQEASLDVWSLAASAGPWVLLAVVVVGAAAFIWWDRRQKMKEHGI